MSNDNSDKEVLLPEKSYEPLSPLQQYMQSWKLLKSAPKDLWLVYAIKFCTFHSFMTVASSLMIFLSETKDISDTGISKIYLLFGFSSILIGIVFSSFADRYGVKIVLIIGTFLLTLKNVLMASIQITNFQILLIIFPGMAPSLLVMPALESSLKFYSTIEYRNLAISFFGSVAHLASLFSGLAIQIILNVGNERNDSTFTILFTYSSIVSFIGFVLSCFIENHQDFNEKKEQKKVSAWKHSREVFVLKNFWRLILVFWLLVTLRVIFMNSGIILPLYMDRDLGNDEYYGVMLITHQLIIVIATPFFNYMSYFVSVYNSFIIIGLLAVVSPLPFLFGASYYSILSYIILISIAESILLPRITEYALEMAPKGKESIVITLASIPLVFGIFITGIIGGFLLDSYCPENGEKKCWEMWAVLSFVALPAVLILIIFKTCLENQKFENNPFLPCSNEAKGE